MSRNIDLSVKVTQIIDNTSTAEFRDATITKVNLDGTYSLTYATGETECISELTLQEILGAMEEHQWLNNEAQMARFTSVSYTHLTLPTILRV